MRSTKVRFGQFVFDTDTGELNKAGTRVRLQAQPARVLAALVARPGELVSRDALKHEIWGEGTHVDFERGLNFCIAQVRTALGDSAESPRFIETVPKQGYRFIAPVETQPPAAPQTATPSSPLQLRMARSPGVAAALLAAVALIVAVAWAQRSSALPTVVVVPFYNETGRGEFDTLARAIGDATVARLASDARLDQLSVIGNASRLASPFARQDVQQVAADLSADWVVIGQLKADGQALRVIAHLIRASDMKHLWAQTFDDPSFALEAQSSTAEAIAAAVSHAVASR